MTELRAEYFSNDVIALNADLFAESERLSMAVAGGLPTNWRAAEYRFFRLFEAVSHEDLVHEYQFHETRKWRFDFAHPETLIAVEVDGGVWTGGRHTRGQGYVNDCEKLNAAAAMGWRVFRFPAHRLTLGDAEMVAGAIEQALGTQIDMTNEGERNAEAFVG